jgi:hypothetical protein
MLNIRHIQGTSTLFGATSHFAPLRYVPFTETTVLGRFRGWDVVVISQVVLRSFWAATIFLGRNDEGTAPEGRSLRISVPDQAAAAQSVIRRLFGPGVTDESGCGL